MVDDCVRDVRLDWPEDLEGKDDNSERDITNIPMISGDVPTWQIYCAAVFGLAIIAVAVAIGYWSYHQIVG